MASACLGIILTFLVGITAGQYDPNICTFFDRSSGLIPPPLPTNFELKGESADHLHGFTTYEEWYFDYTNSRAKYMILKNSIEHHYLFDYDTSQIVEWDILHPGVSIKRDPLSHICAATNMEASPFRNVFGYQDWIYLHPKMYNANQALRYGGQYMYAANGTERISERGILTNNFIGCLYDASMNSTMATKYYFTDKKVLPAGATAMKDVIGLDDGFLSVPVKSEFVGVMTDDNGEVQRFNKTMSISWFKAEPEFKAESFQIPPWIHCSNYRGRKEMPKFPLAFSTRLARTQFQVDILGEMAATESESYEQIFYYAEKKLARRDFTPSPFMDTEIYSKFLSYTPVSTIYDFNQGLRYTINQPTGRCYIGPIHDNEFFDTDKPLLFRELATPEEIFLMQTDEMEYKGKAFTRDIECDVWTGKYYDEKYNATYVKETYISTNGWHEVADEMVEYGVPVKQVVIQKELNGELLEGIGALSFLKFKAKPPKLVLFDINNCVEHINHKRFAILLNVNNDVSDLLFKHKFYFLETAQYYLSDVSQVKTPLRVQRLQLFRKAAPTTGFVLTFLVFTLLDKADLDTSAIVVQAGANLEDAVINLQKLISRGDFSISFYPPRTKEETVISIEPGNLYVIESDGSFTPAPQKNSEVSVENENGSDIKPTVVQDDPEKIDVIEQKGMTPSHLALLSFSMLVIGIAIGIAVMYLYIRMYNDRRIDERIQLTTTPKSESNLDDPLQSSP